MNKRSLVMSLVILAGVTVSGCNSLHTQTGGLIGGVGGGVLGSQIGKGKGKLIATGVGSLLGLGVGSYFGSFLDTIKMNSHSINQNTSLIGKINQRQLSEQRYGGSTVVQMNNGSYGGNSLRMNCSLRNNYVVCNGN